jgi:hypothetical protein
VLGNLKDQIAKNGSKIPVEDIIQPLQDNLDEMTKNVQADPTVADKINSLIDELHSTAHGVDRVGNPVSGKIDKGGFLDPEDIMNATRKVDLNLNQIGIYGNKIPKSYKEAGVLGKIRESLSDWTQETANDIGIGNQYSNAKNVYSKVAQDFPQGKGIHKLLQTILEAGGIHSLSRGMLPEQMCNMLAGVVFFINQIKRILYNALKAVKATPAGLSELLSFISK